MSELSDKLETAVVTQDIEATIKLLHDAGGSCQARDLAKLTAKNSGGSVDYSIIENGDKETLVMSKYYYHSDLPGGGIVQDRCHRK